jgi:hypothetical protein
MASIPAILLKSEELCPYGSIIKKSYYVLQFMHRLKVPMCTIYSLFSL